jgi:hypothetical protein
MSDRKKSWREIDKGRDSSRHRDSRKPSQREQNASAAYKRDLEKLFQSGGDVPDRFKGIAKELAPEEGSDEAVWRDAVQALRDADGFRNFVTAVNEFVKAGHRLPGDEDLLLKFLDHPSERIVQLALEKFVALHEGPGLQRAAPLSNRIRTIRSIAEEKKTLDLLRKLEDEL